MGRGQFRWCWGLVVAVALSACAGDDASDASVADAAAAADTQQNDTGQAPDVASSSDAGGETGETGGDPMWAPPDTEGLSPRAVRGTVWIFGPGGGPLEGAAIEILEHPDLVTASGPGGGFEFPEVPPGFVTLVLHADGYPLNQLGTHVVLDEDLEKLDFQAVPQWIYDLFGSLTGNDPDPERCQVSTTVTRWFDGGLPAVHGEPGATAWITPQVAEEHGPVYFDEEVLPTPALTETSVDGGVVWTNIDPGKYVLHAEKEGIEFEDVRILCRPGVLVNAGPPRGLQALNVGSGY